MIYISDREQEKIKSKIKLLPKMMKSEKIGIICFEFIGTFILAYGICVGRYLHPIDQHKPNPNFEFIISCFFYFAVSAAAPFSGGHLNPAVTTAFSRIHKQTDARIYILSQILGAFVGAGIAFLFFDVVPFFYTEQMSFSSLLMDCLGQIFGTFVFVFFVLLIVETNYISGEYFKYLLCAIMLLAGRTFTLRKGCVNPAIAIAFQIYAAIEQKDGMLLVYALGLILGTMIGGLAASYFFRDIYAPLKEGMAQQKDKIGHLEEPFFEEKEQQA